MNEEIAAGGTEMLTRKDMKKRGRHSLKKHYLMFVAVCLIAGFLGAEFTNSLNMIRSYSAENIQISGHEDSASTGALSGGRGMSDVLDEILSGREEEGRKLSDELTRQQIEQAEKGNPALGRSRGVLAQAVNAVSSGSIFVTILSALNSVIGSESIAVAILIIASLLLSFGVWFFINNVYAVISRRIFLEGRCYEKVPVQRFMFLLRVKKWLRASWTMLVTYVLYTLWCLTIAGWVIKRYSYYLVPYIVAENPDIPALRAVTLSRKMMKGHKWECFLFELSFIGWYILDLVSLGLCGILYSNPYKVAAFSEYYTQLRSQAKAAEIEGSTYLDDVYLFEKPDKSLLEEKYADVLAVIKEPPAEMEKLGGIRGFFVNYLGIILLNTREEKEYEEHQARKIQFHALTYAVEGVVYPGRLSPIPEAMKRTRVETLNYMRHYSIWSLVMLFFSFSFVGWLWEVSLHLISDGEFVNRGVLHGPWLPIYGSGAVLILVLLNKVRRYPAMEFLCAVVLCGIVEYGTSYYLEVTHDGKKWWDYSGYFLNLHGRICAEGLLVFGIGGVAFVYILAPLLDNVFKKIQYRILIPVCALLLAAFITDQAYSSKHPNTGRGITDYEACSERRQMPGGSGTII